MESFKEILNLNTHDAKKLLQKMRKQNVRRPYDVKILFLKNCPKMSKMEYDVFFEQYLLANFDCNYSNMFDLNLLIKEHLYSSKVMKLLATEWECQGEYEQALSFLEHVLNEDETNAGARKRKVAIFKEQGLIAEAIKELVDYLKKYMSDMEGWQELCQLYLQVGEMHRAVFCAEELLLHQPHNNLFHQMVADIYYTMGGHDNMEIAKTYYCHALKLNPENMRALLGLILVTNNLLAQQKGNTKRHRELTQLSQWAVSSVARKQKTAEPDITNMMLSLNINE